MRRILLVLGLAACGGGTQRGPEPVHPRVAATTTSTTAPAPTETPGPVTAPVTESECRHLTQHMVDISLNERPADQQVSADEQAKIDWRPTTALCKGMPRETYSCAIAAASMAGMAACDQATRSSSTSNSSVAPGGITPPAPR